MYVVVLECLRTFNKHWYLHYSNAARNEQSKEFIWIFGNLYEKTASGTYLTIFFISGFDGPYHLCPVGMF